ncbi:hypothetical protein K503DRAFT_777934 [Rhizopogon vinicolor AM-OR11-026]|uniref:Uncharacterized protein n=1 Tax=Rhizopogon vinicolor AM-OR11-026 TaxID=1314800 RepID=A0A1B7MEF4_9AGAM|nr:hypothetical protein K503DRAFT_777934 [Rhizopogon vinicolor AM-OR11-026]
MRYSNSFECTEEPRPRFVILYAEVCIRNLFPKIRKRLFRCLNIPYVKRGCKRTSDSDL